MVVSNENSTHNRSPRDHVPQNIIARPFTSDGKDNFDFGNNNDEEMPQNWNQLFRISKNDYKNSGTSR